MMLPSPWRPHTTMAMEKLNRAAREAQPRVISMAEVDGCGRTVPRLERPWTEAAMTSSSALTVSTAAAPTAVQERERLRQPYPNLRVIVLDDDVNTFQHSTC